MKNPCILLRAKPDLLHANDINVWSGSQDATHDSTVKILVCQEAEHRLVFLTKHCGTPGQQAVTDACLRKSVLILGAQTLCFSPVLL